MNRQELLEKMAAALWSAAGMDWHPQDFSKTTQAERERCLRAADAALSVAIDELRKRVSERVNRFQDIQSWHEKESRNGLVCEIRDAADEEFAKLERVKTIEERVTVSEGGTYPHTIWIVLRDGENVLHMSKSSYSREDAEIYRLGLIAQLKESNGR
jgi:hypothetical protein